MTDLPFVAAAPQDDAIQDEVPADEPSDSEFGEWLSKSRIARGLSRGQLSGMSGVSAAQIGNLETGRSSKPQARTRDRLAKALKAVDPGVDPVHPDPGAETLALEDEPDVAPGLGPLTGFDPHDSNDWPECPGVYVLYDITDRPVYVGKSMRTIAERLKEHEDRFWFKRPVVEYGEFIRINDEDLCGKIEVVLIKFLKRNAV